MYKITPWHYYNTKYNLDDIKVAPNFCGGDSKDELQALDATKVTKKAPPDTVKNLIIKSDVALEAGTLKPFNKNLEHLYLLCTAGEFVSELLENCECLRGLYIAYNKNLKQVPNRFFTKAATLKKLVINHTEINLTSGIFAGLDSLEELDLQENNIKELKVGVLCDLPKLQKLILARNKISQIHPNALNKNSCLSHIDLSNNALETWSYDLPNNSSLKYLKLSHNKLADTANFGMLTQLFQLNLDFNKIAKVDKNVFGGKMERLDFLALNNNKISVIEEDAFDLQALRILLLDHNKIQKLSEKVFEKLPQLQQLTLDHNDITIFQLDVLAPLKSLNNLVIGCSNITDLSNSTNTGPESLSSLHLDDNNLTRLNKNIFSGFSAVTTLELNDSNLEILDINWCVGLEALKQLNLSGNKLKELKCETFKSLKVLKTLNLSGNYIATIEKGAFRNLSVLSTLNLCDNRLESVCDHMFEDLSGLRSLALGNNDFTVLQNNSFGCLPNLIYLDLSENRITDIEEMVFVNVKHLVTLDLGYNGLTHWPNLSETCELAKLILSFNYLKEFSNTILNALTSLSQLHVDNNDIKFIDPAILEMSSVRELNFDDNKLDSDVVQKIRSFLEVRQIRRRVSVRIEPREKCRKVIL